MNPRTIAVFFVVAASLMAQFSVLRADGTRVSGAFVGVGPDGALSIRVGDASVRVDPAVLVALEGDPSPSLIPTGMLRFDLRDGSRVIGRLTKGGDETLEVVGLCTGALRFAIEDIDVVWNLGLPHSGTNLGGDAKKDGLYVDRDGRLDALPGTLVSLASDAATFSSAAGTKRAFAWNKDRVAAIRLASEADRPVRSSTVTLELRDGSRLMGQLVPSSGPTLHVKLVGGGEAMVDPSGLRVAMFTGGKFKHISDLQLAVTDRPFLPTLLSREVLKDKGLGTWLRIGRVVYTKGLLIPAGIEVRFPLDGATSFRGDLGVDPGVAGRSMAGSVRFVFLVADRVVGESRELRAGDEPQSMQIDGLKGAKELTIRVIPASPAGSALRAVLGNAWLVP